MRSVPHEVWNDDAQSCVEALEEPSSGCNRILPIASDSRGNGNLEAIQFASISTYKGPSRHPERNLFPPMMFLNVSRLPGTSPAWRFGLVVESVHAPR